VLDRDELWSALLAECSTPEEDTPTSVEYVAEWPNISKLFSAFEVVRMKIGLIMHYKFPSDTAT
jgi:hypothetical protein